ncbi:exo-alpha-sialidase [Streptomyces sp. NPDC060205]|uniref:sialidase family protein n=1 Tax=Streptomyces sp. NPDC060205 TaxID=3347072 RepID=UPI00365ADCAA
MDTSTTDLDATEGRVHPRPGDTSLAEALLPTPHPANHASFVQLLPDGSLGCTWFAGSEEGRPDVYIYFSRLPPGADRWLPAVRVSCDEKHSEQNPVLACLPDGTLWLAYTAQVRGAQDTAVVKVQRSDDLGATWSAPRPLFDTPGIFIRHGLVQLTEERWLLPVFHCHSLPGRQWDGDWDTSAVAVTEDAGRTWRQVEVPESTGVVHMCIVPLKDGTLAAFFRSRWADAVHRSESTDGGETWSAPVALDVPNNNSSLQVARVGAEDDELLMVLNPVAAPPGSAEGDRVVPETEGKVTAEGEIEPLRRHAVWGTPRLPLSLMRSTDRGLTWSRVLDLETEAPESIVRVEFSYPALVPGPGGEAHITYTYGRDAIKYVRVPRERIAG